MSSLSEITGVEKAVLREKFGLAQPLYQYGKNEKENRVFMSSTVLLKDSELRHGGYLEMGAKKVLSLVTKDILESKDCTPFQVPEITCLHMGYGRTSANKEGRMALSPKDAKTWLNILNLSALDLHNLDQKMDIDDPLTGRDPLTQEEERAQAMEVDPSIHGNYDDTVYPPHSGLLIPQKGSRILCMSILIINDSKWNIGANKISDFLSFWILPYLLNYTHRKVQEIMKHHEAEQKDPMSLVKTVKKSAWDIIREATQSKPEILLKLRQKLEKYYTAEKLQEQYTLLKRDDGSPVVLVPLQFVWHKGKAESLRMEDLGRKWEWDGKVLSKKEFLHAFVKRREVQMDYFYCMKDAKLRQGVDYAIILPDQASFGYFLTMLREADPNVFTRLKHVKPQGRGMISPYHSVVKCEEQNLVVCFTYFQGADNSSVAALFRAVGAHYLNHFTVVFLHGSTLDKDGSDCNLGNLYHVRVAEQLHFTQLGKLKKTGKISFCQGISKFAEHDFPSSYCWWIQNVRNDPDVMAAIVNHSIEPTFDCTKHLKAAFAKASQEKSLRNACLKEDETSRNSNVRKLSRYQIQAANLNGLLLSKIQQCGRKGNIGVTLGISNTLGPDDPPPMLKAALNKIICYFVIATIKAGLQLVFPSEPDEKNREEIDSEEVTEDEFEEESEEEDWDEESVKFGSLLSRGKVLVRRGDECFSDRADSADSDSTFDYGGRKRPTAANQKGYKNNGDFRADSTDSDSSVQHIGSASRQKGYCEMEDECSQQPATSEARLSVTPPTGINVQAAVKVGTPSNDELEELANEIADSWKKLARRLKVEEAKITAIHKENEELSEKAYKILLHWRQTNAPVAPATYQVLFDALNHHLVGRSDLAEKYCCEK
ncbi:uncharacterized protein LOC144642577 isoform X2 [Oculina patagonica]